MKPLTEALNQLFSDTPFEGDETRTWRQSLQEILDVDPLVEEDWVKGKLLPAPDELRMIVDLIKMVPSLPTTLLDLLPKPLAEITSARHYSKYGRLSLSNSGDEILGSYMLRPQRKELARRLARLPWERQEELILQFNEIMRG